MQSARILVGYVNAVFGDEIHVATSDEFIESAHAMRRGQPGEYALVETGTTQLVGLIASSVLTVEEDPRSPSRPQGSTTAPVGKMIIQLFGKIRGGKFSRGVDRYPMIRDVVELAASDDLGIILSGRVDMGDSKDTHETLHLGQSALNSAYPTLLNSKHFFGKHVAVVGNSGAGKSCTVARILSEAIKSPHAQIILFDLHGEYRQAFSTPDGKPLSNVTYLNDRDLVMPYWLLAYRELETILVDRASPEMVTSQCSLLKDALRRLKRPAAERCDLLGKYSIDTPIYYSMDQLRIYAENMNDARFVMNTDRFAFAKMALRNMEAQQQEEYVLTQRCQFNQGNAEGEVPHALYHQKLHGLIDRLDHMLNDCRYDFLMKPIEHARQSPLFTKLFPDVLEDHDDWTQMVDWVVRLLLGRLNPTKNLTIVDLSGIPFDIIDLTVGLLTRLIYDFHFFAAHADRHPVVLVFEEAHNYIPREEFGRDSFARIAVERVAKEGRKYGVSAMIVSQRPSELSKTVLSQCNNLIVMRLNNPDDQAYITKVVADQFADMTKMLPALQPGEAYVIGDCVPLPMRTLIRMPDHQPSSETIDFIRAWQKGTDDETVERTLERWFRQVRPGDTISDLSDPTATHTAAVIASLIAKKPS